jgi:hypothetical protein
LCGIETAHGVGQLTAAQGLLRQDVKSTVVSGGLEYRCDLADDGDLDIVVDGRFQQSQGIAGRHLWCRGVGRSITPCAASRRTAGSLGGALLMSLP